MLCGSQSWKIKKKKLEKIDCIKIRMIRWISDNTLKSEIHNENIWVKLEVTPDGVK